MRPALFLAGLLAAAPAAVAAPPRPWWQGAVIYEIYPRSFQDSNGDGVGDLNGITSRLDHLQRLGVDAIWLTPVYPSPQVDFGYDIADYEAIDPAFGTMADFDRLLAEAKKRGIRVVMDLVLNHSSERHSWFRQSRASRSNPKRDWYVWRDGRPGGGPPNNWISLFGGSAWQRDPATGQYYYHRFYAEQPDLNWENPAVRAAMYDVARFWMKRGVAGFRLDAIPSLFEDPAFGDEPVVTGDDGKPLHNAYGDVIVDSSKTDNLPRVHEVLRELRRVTDAFSGTVLIGETYLPSISELAKMYGAHGDELQLPMDMQIAQINRLDAPLFRTRIDEVERKVGGGEPLLVFTNHDNPRFDKRYGDGLHDAAIQKMLATVLLATRGTALLYYGDEIGMTTTTPARREDVRDPIGIRGWPKEKGRDGERTPMQWQAGAGAGFTRGRPWLPVPADSERINAASEAAQPDSMLSYYRALIALRRREPVLHDGTERMIDVGNSKILSWVREQGGRRIVVACNFTASPEIAALGEAGRNGRTLLASFSGAPASAPLDRVTLPPFGAWIAAVD
jgi:alpha-glucosidase